ncbi:endonuclease/exonuclease/phosphatase family protein [Kitasatospora sp. NPDC004531]
MSMEAALLESRTLRSGLCERTEVLDEVKALVLLPDGLHATTRMVAEYFGVSENVIRSVLRRHREELESSGFTVLMPVDNSGEQRCKEPLWQVSGLQGGQSDARAGDLPGQRAGTSGEQECNPNFWQVSAPEAGLGHRPQGGGNGVALYSRRAVLNVAMLLRDSEVAREVRRRLLDLIESAVRPVAGHRFLPAPPWKRWSELRWDEEEAVRRNPAVAVWRRRIDGLEPFEGCPRAGEEPPEYGFTAEELPGVVAELAAALGSVDRRLDAQGLVITAISERISRQESRLDAHGARLDSLGEHVLAIRRDVAHLRRRRRGQGG